MHVFMAFAIIIMKKKIVRMLELVSLLLFCLLVDVEINWKHKHKFVCFESLIHLNGNEIN